MGITAFGAGLQIHADINEHGGKGAGLIEMSNMSLPVPEGFILPTSYCMDYLHGIMSSDTLQEIHNNVTLNVIELETKAKNPVLVSIRSGARVSMPGMMDTILNVGLTEDTLINWYKILGEKTTLDSYCRLLCMMGETAYGLYGLTNYYKTNKLEKPLDSIVQGLVDRLVEANVPRFWEDVDIQYRDAITAVWNSWNSERAMLYRDIHGYSHEWGTAVTIQRMVFGNRNNESASGVVFTRNPDTGTNKLYGEFLLNAQGEDVVNGSVTPEDIHELKVVLPETYYNLIDIASQLEKERKDVQDIEFTIENGCLYILQTRTAKRSSAAAFKIAHDFLSEGAIDLDQALLRCTYKDYINVSKVSVDYNNAPPTTITGIPASTGVVSATITTDIEVAIAEPNKYILVREETTPDDLQGMIASVGVITLTGGATSHAAVVARGLNIPCIVGCSLIKIEDNVAYIFDGIIENDIVTMDGSKGHIWVSSEVPVTQGYSVQANSLVTQKLTELNRRVYVYSKNMDVVGAEHNTKIINILGDFDELSRILPTVPDNINVTIYLDPALNDMNHELDTLLEIMGSTSGSEVLTEILNNSTGKKNNVRFITFDSSLRSAIIKCGFLVLAATDYIGGIISANTDEILLNITDMCLDDIYDVIALAQMAGIEAYTLKDIDSESTVIKEKVFNE